MPAQIVTTLLKPFILYPVFPEPHPDEIILSQMTFGTKSDKYYLALLLVPEPIRSGTIYHS
jgi:hypothetical protein